LTLAQRILPARAVHVCGSAAAPNVLADTLDSAGNLFAKPLGGRFRQPRNKD
jgi:hypothetical protein